MSDLMADEVFIDDLIDPDGAEPIAYNWDEEFQRHILSVLLVDRQFLLQSLDLIKPNYFTNKAQRQICSILFEFFMKYRLLPKRDFIVQEIKSAISDEKSLAFYLGEINTLFDYFEPGLESRDYLQDKIAYFAKIQAIQTAFHQCLKFIDQSPESEDTWIKVYEKLREAMTVDRNFEIGIDYLANLKDRYARSEEDDENGEIFSTGFQDVDTSITNGGYCKGEILAIVAGSGVGKSVLMTSMAADWLIQGKHGVYISLELDAEKVAERFDAIVADLPIKTLHQNKEEVIERVSSFMSSNPADIPLIIKQFPAGTADVNTVRAYLSQLKFHGFNPDFVVIDYVGEMRDIPGLPTHESRERLVREMRGLATEEDIFVVTALQPNRISKEVQESRYIDENHLADSFGQIRPLDGCISLNQNDGEKTVNVGRGYVIKQRDGKSRFSFFLEFNPETLRIRQLSKEKYKSTMAKHFEQASDETEVDSISYSGSTKRRKKMTEEDKVEQVVKKGWEPSKPDND